ncbi:MAG: hypothetical protein IIB64_08385 [Proteobacteria bacterium]|nr:hypothetical protein [Pseudomonadota bacterium]
MISQPVGLELVQMGGSNALLNGRNQAHHNEDRAKQYKDYREDEDNLNLDSQFHPYRSRRRQCFSKIPKAFNKHSNKK